MRWIFYLLFLSNTAFFLAGFFLFRPQSELAFVAPQPIAINTSSIVLLEERPVEKLPGTRLPERTKGLVGIESLSTPMAENLPAPSVVSDKCYKVGPLRSSRDARFLAERLTLPDGTWKSDEIPERKDVTYWVYIPPRESKGEALELLRQLQSQGVDSFAVSEGDDLNAISLGTFKNSSSAEVLKDRIATLGYEAQVKTKEKITSSFWVYYKVREGELPQLPPMENSLASTSVFSCEVFALQQ